jgi:hypothetical protein
VFECIFILYFCDSSMSRPQTKISHSDPHDVSSEVSFSQPAVTTELPAYLEEAQNALNKDLPNPSTGENLLNKIGKISCIGNSNQEVTIGHYLEDGVNSIQGQQAAFNTIMPPVKAFVAATGISDAIEKGINKFLEETPIVMKMLDEVAKVHPVIAGVFLNLTHFIRESDDKIL